MELLENKWMRTWMAAMDLEVGDGELLFEFVDSGVGKVTARELLNGLVRLKGPARSIDLISLSFRFSRLEDLVEQLCKAVTDDGPGVQKRQSEAEKDFDLIIDAI